MNVVVKEVNPYELTSLGIRSPEQIPRSIKVSASNNSDGEQSNSIAMATQKSQLNTKQLNWPKLLNMNIN